MNNNDKRLNEIIIMADKLKWIRQYPKEGYPLMYLSEVEKCMIAMVDDYELNIMREWVKEKAK